MMSEKKRQESRFSNLRRYWSVMSFYERFEQIIALILTFIIAIIVVIALARLCFHVLDLLNAGALDPANQDVFKNVFSMIMTLLIAMEFKHSILKVAVKNESIVQVKTVLLIAVMALARKFIIIETKTTSALTIAALGFVLLVLGAVYWFVKTDEAPK